MTVRVAGSVKWFNIHDGAGVISRAKGKGDCAIRHSAMSGTILHMLAKGQPVEFEVVAGTTGPAAWRAIKR